MRTAESLTGKGRKFPTMRRKRRCLLFDQEGAWCDEKLPAVKGGTAPFLPARRIYSGIL
jgi:hypothetical protein